MLERWKKYVGTGKDFGALLTDISKAFDCLEYELLTAKLNADDFNLYSITIRTWLLAE